MNTLYNIYITVFRVERLLKLQTINYINIRSMDTVLPQPRVEKINSCMIRFKNILVVKFLVYSTLVHLAVNTKQEQNYETII